jgi:hypothetical protein
MIYLSTCWRRLTIHMRPESHALSPRKGVARQHRERSRVGLFAFWTALGRLWRGIKAPTGTWSLTGFGVIESPVGASIRLAEGFELERLYVDSSDAPMPWLREALKPVNLHRVGLPSPSTVHQEAYIGESND